MTDPTSPPLMHFGLFDPVDSFTTSQSLDRAVIGRRPEYVRPHKIRVKIGTWNVAACPGTDEDLARWFVDGEGIDKHFAALDSPYSSAVTHDLNASNEHDPDSFRLVGGNDIGLYVVGLQEVVKLNKAKEYMNRAVNIDNSQAGKWQATLEAALPPGYQLVMSEQMTGLLLMIYASSEVARTITNVSTKQVDTGHLGCFGNKGAITSRLVLGETTRVVFVNCHLASGAGSRYLDRRCSDIDQVLAKTKFEPVVHAGVSEGEGEMIGDEDFAFWFGDLNFRLDGLPADNIRRLLTLTREEYGLSGDRAPLLPLGDELIVMRTLESDEDSTTIEFSVRSREQRLDSKNTTPEPDDFPEHPSQVPTSLQATLDSLLRHDQLQRMVLQRKVFHDGWREGPITFLPSYKYDVGTAGLYDFDEKQRAPSWCDRILYRTRKDKQEYDTNLQEEAAAWKRDEETTARGIGQADVLSSDHPAADGHKQPGGAPRRDYNESDELGDPDSIGLVTKEGHADRISLDIYTSNQRITSSDHKPVISVFTLEYDAVVPELKAKVFAQVAREIDENTANFSDDSNESTEMVAPT